MKKKMYILTIIAVLFLAQFIFLIGDVKAEPSDENSEEVGCTFNSETGVLTILADDERKSVI
ncbi:MAG: hypothetical protein IKN09_00010 [Clostridia bacterium]|nr:hypothetical protein [Clostridia bacterium]